MGTRWLLSVLALTVALAGCADQPAGSADAGERSTGLPIASAQAPASEAPSASGSPSASESMPAWDEPEDPVDAYHVLIDKVAYMRAHPSLAFVQQIYAPKSRMARSRREIKQMIEDGTRVVDGRTVLEEIRLLSQDSDTAFLRIQGREEGWVTVDADGNRTPEPAQCEQYVVELRDHGDGWRIATVIVGDKSIRRCEK